ncbi:hypothetical protein CEXT_691961 [Caerostris extrusa]|uniref:Uncharacterized protein n=1 Tax=Caerostris extrusa TaxID=172846 RepID=A0AAV4VFF3_CAEEX|nr:hypothetical protein CEXT_691961 [Caerostris extrusa]
MRWLTYTQQTTVSAKHVERMARFQLMVVSMGHNEKGNRQFTHVRNTTVSFSLVGDTSIKEVGKSSFPLTLAKCFICFKMHSFWTFIPNVERPWWTARRTREHTEKKI